MLTWEKDGGMREGEAELIVRTLNLFSGRSVSEELLLSHPKHQQLMEITNRVCHRLSLFRQSKESPLENTTTEIESNMQYLVKMVLTKDSDEDLNSDVKQTFLTVTKTFYYTAYCDPGTINFHIAKVLFERVP
nr:ent-copalyl diphosphate synthase, chloroplastic-like [Ipomoea batatas]